MILNKAVSGDTITAISTGKGGAVAIIRISGSEAIKIADFIFTSKSGNRLSTQKGFTLHYGILSSDEGERIDDVILSLFRTPHSYTGEDMVEISCHGSNYILGAVLSLILSKGARMADAGEFTLRAYCNGKMDLVQAEAVADLIASDSAASHRLAINQMRGGYSKEFVELRSQLLTIMSLMELELDFGEEDVVFADRAKLKSLLTEISVKIDSLTNSFAKGNAIKNGVPVAIVGRPNAGKSTLLNALLRDDRAIVSDIAGTTRDVIEESITLTGVQFRFIDTAGIRETSDKLESMGIERTMKAISGADVVLLVIDSSEDPASVQDQISTLPIEENQHLVVIFNKNDKKDFEFKIENKSFKISAKERTGIKELEEYLSDLYGSDTLGDGSVIISNMRHYDLLKNAGESVKRCVEGIENGLPSDLITQELRETSYSIGSLTGTISSDEILGNIFQHFCIGK